MSAVTEAFTGVGAGPVFLGRQHESFTYAVTGTFSGNWIFEKSTNGGATWEQVATGTSTLSATTIFQGADSELYRFRCSAYTSGTITGTITDVSTDPIPGYLVQNSDGETVLDVRDDGIVTTKITRPGDEDTYIIFADDQFDLYVGGRNVMRYTESTADEISFNPGSVDQDTEFKRSGGFNWLEHNAGDDEISIGATKVSWNSYQKETIDSGDAVSVLTAVTQIDNTTNGAGAITLAAPDASMLGRTKLIEMTVDNGNVTLALTNVQGGSAATTATFADVNDALMLVGGENKWHVIGESGVALS